VADREYIEKLRNVILYRYACESSWVESLPVHDVFRDQVIWDGFVEVFSLSGHPKAKIAYAWIEREGKADTGERVETVLEIPPVDSPHSAVWASIMADSMRGL
jgi:hypothetical protein